MGSAPGAQRAPRRFCSYETPYFNLLYGATRANCTTSTDLFKPILLRNCLAIYLLLRSIERTGPSQISTCMADFHALSGPSHVIQQTYAAHAARGVQHRHHSDATYASYYESTYYGGFFASVVWPSPGPYTKLRALLCTLPFQGYIHRGTATAWVGASIVSTLPN